MFDLLFHGRLLIMDVAMLLKETSISLLKTSPITAAYLGGNWMITVQVSGSLLILERKILQTLLYGR